MNLKRLLGYSVVGFVLINLLILLTDHSYLYKGFASTYLVGKLGPQIDESNIFYNRGIGAKNSRTWLNHLDYNKSRMKADALKELENLGTVSFLIIKDNQLFFEKYWEGFNQHKATNSFSVAKSVVSILTGIALSEENSFTSLDQPISDFLPDFKQDAKGKVLVKHLLTMSSGLSWSESGLNPFSENAKAYYGDNLNKLILERMQEERPGVNFKYKSGDTQLLAMVLEKATGKKLSEYAEEKLWTPLEAENDGLWCLDKKNGMEKAFCSLYATPRDFARIGQLYLNGGKWNGKQIVDKDYIIESLKPAELIDVQMNKDNERYGYSWWLEIYKNMNIFYARGIKGQYIITIPSEKMVIVRTGHHRASKEINGHHEDFYFLIDVALDLTN